MQTTPMSDCQVKRFLTYLNDRIEKHNQNLSWHRGQSEHRMLVKTERAEAEVIRNAFLNVLKSKKHRPIHRRSIQPDAIDPII